jgi:hypothetical protein
MGWNRLRKIATLPRPDGEAVKPRNTVGAHSDALLLREKSNPDFRYPVLLYRNS